MKSIRGVLPAVLLVLCCSVATSTAPTELMDVETEGIMKSKGTGDASSGTTSKIGEEGDGMPSARAFAASCDEKGDDGVGEAKYLPGDEPLLPGERTRDEDADVVSTVSTAGVAIDEVGPAQWPMVMEHGDSDGDRSHVSVDDVGYTDIIDLAAAPSPVAAETTSLPATASLSDASRASSGVQIGIPTTDTERDESFGTSADITAIDPTPLFPGILTDTPLSSSGSSAPDTTDETHNGHVHDGIEAASSSLLDSDIGPAHRSTMSDDDNPAVPGINADYAYPSSASPSPTLHAPTRDEIGASTDPSATAPAGPAAKGSEDSTVIEPSDITSTSDTPPTGFDGVEHSYGDSADPDDMMVDSTMEQYRGDANQDEGCVTTPAALESDDGSEQPAGIENDGGSAQPTGFGSDNDGRSTNFDRSNNSNRAADSEIDGGDQSAESNRGEYDKTGGTPDKNHGSAAQSGYFDDATKADDKRWSDGGQSSGESGAGDVHLASQDAAKMVFEEVWPMRFTLGPDTPPLLPGEYMSRGCDGRHSNVAADMSAIPRPDFLPRPTDEPICMWLDDCGQLKITPGYEPDVGKPTLWQSTGVNNTKRDGETVAGWWNVLKVGRTTAGAKGSTKKISRDGVKADGDEGTRAEATVHLGQLSVQRKTKARGFFFWGKNSDKVLYRSPKPKEQWKARFSWFSQTGRDIRNAELKVTEDQAVVMETPRGWVLWEPILLGDY